MPLLNTAEPIIITFWEAVLGIVVSLLIGFLYAVSMKYPQLELKRLYYTMTGKKAVPHVLKREDNYLIIDIVQHGDFINRAGKFYRKGGNPINIMGLGNGFIHHEKYADPIDISEQKLSDQNKQNALTIAEENIFKYQDEKTGETYQSEPIAPFLDLGNTSIIKAFYYALKDRAEAEGAKAAKKKASGFETYALMGIILLILLNVVDIALVYQLQDLIRNAWQNMATAADAVRGSYGVK